MNFVVLLGVCIVFVIIFYYFRIPRHSAVEFLGIFLSFSLERTSSSTARAIHHSDMGAKKKKVVVWGTEDLHVPGGGGVTVNSVPVITREKYA